MTRPGTGRAAVVVDGATANDAADVATVTVLL
jgi:hypothetical protein